MDNLRAITAPMQRVPVLNHPASHEIHSPRTRNSSALGVYPPRRASSAVNMSSGEPREYGPAQKHIEGGRRQHPTDTADISPEALRAHREHYKASEMHLCSDCDLVHAKGKCPLDVPPLEERSDWNPEVDPELGRALMWTVLGLIVIAAVIAALRGFF